MLPSSETTGDMEQSTLNQVFALFGKGVTQMLQQSVNQQTIIDEIRAQLRSLQSQVSNVTASLDEIEERIFIRLQNQQPTIYTREGLPIDDALDVLNGKIQSANEKIVSNSEAITKIDADLASKIDREELTGGGKDSQGVNESFNNLSSTVKNLKKELQRQRKETESANERVMKTIKFQIESQLLQHQMGKDADISIYVTKDDLRKELAKLKVEGGLSSRSANELEDSATVNMVLQGGIADEKKLNKAFKILKRRKKNLENNYSQEAQQIDEELAKLMKIAKNAKRDDQDDYDYDDDDDGEEGEGGKGRKKNSLKKGRRRGSNKASARSGRKAVSDNEATGGRSRRKKGGNNDKTQEGRARGKSVPIKPSRGQGNQNGDLSINGSDDVENEAIKRNSELMGEGAFDKNSQDYKYKNLDGSNDSDQELDEETRKQREKLRLNKLNRDGSDEENDYDEFYSDDAIEYDYVEHDENEEFTPHEQEYVNVGLDTNGNYEAEQVQVRTTQRPGRQRNIGLVARKKSGCHHRKNNEEGLGSDDNMDGSARAHGRTRKSRSKHSETGDKEGSQMNDQDKSELDNEYDSDYDQYYDSEEDTEDGSKEHSKRSRRKGINSIIEKIEKSQKKSQQNKPEDSDSQRPSMTRLDEQKLTQRILEVIIPRVEHLLVDTLAGSSAAGTMKLDKNEAKQLITQLSILDSLKEEIKGIKLKLAMKIDRVKVENELKTKLSRDEFFQYLAALFPDNQAIKQMAQEIPKSRLPSLNGRKNILGSSMDHQIPRSVIKAKSISLTQPKGTLVMQTNRNSNMIALNQKFLRGADGHYYLRDMTSDPNSIQAVQGNILGTDNADSVDINATLDFQPFRRENDDSDMRLNPSVVKVIREDTPED